MTDLLERDRAQERCEVLDVGQDGREHLERKRNQDRMIVSPAVYESPDQAMRTDRLFCAGHPEDRCGRSKDSWSRRLKVRSSEEQVARAPTNHHRPHTFLPRSIRRTAQVSPVRIACSSYGMLTLS